MMLNDIGVVVIGRNEGERLTACLKSLVGRVSLIVYVDSGSTDGSVTMARALGVEVVELDMRSPFTAARARNHGFSRMQELAPNLSLVQFIDGDCEMADGWLDAAASFIGGDPKVAVVFGRRRERHPERSVYNRLCDIEWDTPLGEVKSCGGDAMMRVSALASVDGYRPGLIAGEEPELCFRFRADGWQIWRLNQEMTIHDAAILRFSQWWKRSMRGGHAFAEGAYLHGASLERYCVRESRRAWLWGLLMPIAVIVLLPFSRLGGLMILLYPLQVVRIGLKSDLSGSMRWQHALFMVLARFPEAMGQVRFLVNRLVGRRSQLIEYK
jgi:glycosyltransferase involved in cell wall biosynthesis